MHLEPAKVVQRRDGWGIYGRERDIGASCEKSENAVPRLDHFALQRCSVAALQRFATPTTSRTRSLASLKIRITVSSPARYMRASCPASSLLCLRYTPGLTGIADGAMPSQ